jgi:Protein of unknown function (DUF2480)
MEPIVNRVAESEIEVFDLESLWDGKDVVTLDLKPFLYEGLILREKPFRTMVREHDWSEYTDRHVAITSPPDTIIPTWAFMLLASRLEPHAATVTVGPEETAIERIFSRALAAFDFEVYRDAIVVVKGCGSGLVPATTYADAMMALQQVARKLMYGEPCSSVALWRRPAVTGAGDVTPAGGQTRKARLPDREPR